MPARRRFPPPWSIDLQPGCYVVRDASGQALSWHYFRDDEWSANIAKVLTREEARKMAVNFARLPDLLAKGRP
jgi:hypothetical protein